MAHVNKKTAGNPFKLVIALATFTAMIVVSSGAQAMNDSKTKSTKAKSEECMDKESKGQDTWIQGKLEGAYLLNRHLNPVEIDTEVKSGTVFLSGNVDSDIEKDLAGEIAKSIEGVKSVENKLTVRPENFKKNSEKSAKKESDSDDHKDRTFVQKIKDASITAAVKVKLLANSNTDGSDINVDTMRQAVTLNGKVDSDQERELAEKIASNTEDVVKVINKLKVEKSKG